MSWRYQRGNQNTLCCLFFFEIRILIAPLYLQDILLSSLFWYTDSGYPFGIFKTLNCLLIFERTDITMFWRYKGVIRIRNSMKNRKHNVLKIQMGDQNPYIEEEQTTQWITPLYLQDIVLSVLLWYTDSDYPFGIFKLFL
jgi:hypothetical protein